jgi:hypothetical protein
VSAASSVRSRSRQALDVRALLEWAFAIERAELEFPARGAVEERATGHGIEWILMQRAALGVEVDGGGRSLPAHDADLVAGVVASLPHDLGGAGMAIRVAQHARACSAPDWMPWAEPRVVPREWRRTRHGWRARTECIGRRTVERRGRRLEVDVLWCPVRIAPHPDRIAEARWAWRAWVAALAWVRDELVRRGELERHAVTAALPPAAPWDEAWAPAAPVGG